MNLNALLAEVLQLTGTFNPRISIILFLLCAVGEVGFTLPYILETIWLMAGYQLAQGKLSPMEILYIWLVAQAGRQAGTVALYYSGMLGMIPLRKLYRRYIEPRIPKRFHLPGVVTTLAKPSPFSIAVGRLIGLRIPAALTSSASGKLGVLSLGVLISSVVWDGVYLILGRTVGVKVVPEPTHMLIYSVAGLTGLYLLTLGIRYLFRWRRAKRKTQCSETS